MSFKDCVEAAVKSGRLSREQAEDLYTRQRDATERFTLDSQHSPESAARMAEELGIEQAKQNVRLQKYQAALQAIRNSQNADDVLGYQHGPTLAVRTKLARDSRGAAQWDNVETRARGILGLAHAKMAEGISQLRTRWLGFQRDSKMLQNAVREAFGEATGDARAAGFARAWGEAAEMLRQRFNRAGGAIPRRADWGMPQVHDAVRVGRASRSEWVDFVKERLDIERMLDVETGSAFTPDSLEVVLQGVYETIRTNGLADMTPGVTGGKKLANRHQDARFLVFKDADGWLEYQDRFGSDNLFGTMMSHLQGMSRDVALLEVMGPNPAASFRYLQDLARQREDKPLRRQGNEAIFRMVSGAGDANRSPFLAQLFGVIRSWNVARALGGAALSAVSDIGFIRATAKWNGLSFAGAMRRYLGQLNPANEADRIMATRIGMTALSAAEAYSNVGRFVELEGAAGGALGKLSHVGHRFAEATLRASGLSAMTDAGRRAFTMEFSSSLAENFSKPLDAIEGNLGKTLREHGMTPEEWDLIRTTPTTKHKGAEFFTVDALLERADLPLSQRQALLARVQQILNEEQLRAVPEPDALARSWTTWGRPRGDMWGEIGRTVMQFKSFPIAVLSLHAMRMMYARQMRGTAGAAAYAANLIIATTVLGAIAVQAKLIQRGKDPRDWEDPKLWAAAFAQGGGAGIYGDFLFADANRFGGGITETLLGPSAGMANDAWKLTWGNVQEAIKGEDADVAADAVGFASRYTPGGSLWYTRLLLEREVFDQLAIEADPAGARRRFRRSERRAREQGTDYWWRPGQTAPDRAPQVGDQ
jgi:hypothetical protein